MSEISERFESSVGSILAPALTDLGFKRARMHFRRVRGEIVDVITLARSKYGDSCIVFLGMHLTFLPLEVVNNACRTFDLEKLNASTCAFRTSLLSRFSRRQDWRYESVFRSAPATTRAILREYLRSGERLFRQFERPRDFAALVTVQSVQQSPKNKLFGWLGGPGACLTFARIHAHMGETEEARTYANAGLRMLGHAAELEEPLRELANAT